MPLLRTLRLLTLLSFGPMSIASPSPDEVDRHVATLRQQFEDSDVSVAQRERVALEAAATLDRAAQAAPTAEASRARWAQAIALLDEFGKAHPDQPRRREFGFQAAVYQWAIARSLTEQADTAPDPRAVQAEALAALDNSIERLKKVEGTQALSGEVLDQNIRFRLAQALIDRVGLLPADNEDRNRSEKHALTLLELPMTEPALRGYALLLKAELLARMGASRDPGTGALTDDAERKANIEKASQAAEAAARNVPPPPAFALLESRVAILQARRSYPAAIQAIDAAKGDDVARAALAIRVLLDQRAALKPDDPTRPALDSEILKRLTKLEKRNEPEIVRTRLAVGRSIRSLGPESEPSDFGLLAECRLAMKDPKGAAGLADQGADRAMALGRKPEETALRMRSGAILFQAGLFSDADLPLSKVIDDDNAGSIRPKASLIRAMARGRGVIAGQAGCTPASYQKALDDHLKAYPDDPTAGEASWLLARVRRGEGRTKEATKLFAAIPASHPRWLDARRSMAEIDQNALEAARQTGDRSQVRADTEAARARIVETLALAKTDAERVAIELDRVRLELIPDVGSSEAAREICDRLLKAAATPELRDSVRRLRVVALAKLNRMIEAEQETRDLVKRSASVDLLRVAKLLDQNAMASDSEVVRRRFGMLMSLMTDKVAQDLESLPADLKLEANLRNARALLLSGNIQVARRALNAVANSAALNDDQLRDLADAYDRLDAQGLVVEVQRLRSRKQVTGSSAWFDARYGQALAYYRSGQADEARQLIDGTAILHPELGGGEIRAKFDRLRQRLGKD
jgi:hypothetical protein